MISSLPDKLSLHAIRRKGHFIPDLNNFFMNFSVILNTVKGVSDVSPCIGCTMNIFQMKIKDAIKHLLREDKHDRHYELIRAKYK